MLRLYLFGAPRLVRDGQPVALRRTKALALLIYLAVTGQPHERDALLALLWPEFDAASARNNLRRELSLLRSILGEDALRTDRQQIAWNPATALWVDVAAFRAHLAAANPAPLAALQEAVALAEAEFLAGFSLPDSPAFEEWQFFERESLRRQLADALTSLVAQHRDAAEYAAALPYARRLLALDPLHEPAQRDLIWLYALDGQYAAALRQYEACVRLLAAELGVAPEPETQELGAQVRARRLVAAPVVPAPVVLADHTPEPEQVPEALPTRPVPSALPALSTGFVGRTRELADILRRLTDSDCRLLTLAGPGGVGKTQLALHVAHRLQADLADSVIIRDGVFWVDLLPVADHHGLVVALAAAVGFSFAPGGAPQIQLLSYMRDLHALLVLDNFEHLLEEVGILTELLAAAPGVRLLVTSRTALNVPGEWFHPLDGLAFPADATTAVAQLAHYDAVRLFEQLARQARSDFRLSSVLEPVIRLCRLVEGMPLALELAAGWLKTLTVEQIVTAIERDPDMLSSRDRTFPDRHRNLRAVFTETWRMLSGAEQEAFAGLTVLIGEFSPEAAQAITGAGLKTLASLVERSLLRTAPNGRLHLHELLRQFAAAQSPAVRQAARTRHSDYFLALLAAREPLLMEHGWQAVLKELGPESGNLRAAWLEAVAQQRLEQLDQALYSMSALIMARNDFREGAELFARTVAALPADAAAPQLARRIVARALIREGSFRYQLGDNRSAIALIERGAALAEGAGVQRDRAYAYILLGRIAGWEGDEPTARRQLEYGLQLARSFGAGYLITQALPHLAWLYCSYGDFVTGGQTAEEGLEWSRRSGRPDLIFRALHMLGWSATCRGDYATAEPLYRESLALSEELGHRQGIAASLNGLGWTIWCAGGRLEEARVLHERSLTLLRVLGNGVWISNVLGDLALAALDAGDAAAARALSEEGLRLADTLNNAMYRAYHLGILGHLATHAGHWAAARAALREALQCALATRLWPKVAFVLYQIALLRLYEAEAAGTERTGAIELLAAVAHHPAAWAVYRLRAEQILAEVSAQAPREQVETAVAHGRRLDWAVDLGELYSELV